MKIDSLDRFLLLVSMVGYVILLFRLRASGLYKIYRWFFLYIFFQLVRGAAMFPFRPTTTLYGWLFILSEPVLCVLYTFVVLELYSLVMQKYSGIAILARRLVLWALAAVVALSLVALAPDLSAGPDRYPWLALVYIIERAIVFSLLLFLLLIAGFVAWYPVPLPANVTIHNVVFAAYFLSKNVGLLIRNLTGYEATYAVSTAFQAVACVCLAVWIAKLRKKGEEMRIVVRSRFRREDEERLMAQLSALNNTLARARRK